MPKNATTKGTCFFATPIGKNESIERRRAEQIQRYNLVVADLTGSNANVAYELAVRHAFNKVSVHLIDRADAIPFDLKDERTIVFDVNDLDSVRVCKDELRKFVDAISIGKVQYTSPVFRTLGVAAATAEEKEGFLEKIVDQIDSIATDVSSIELSMMMSDIDQIESLKDSVSNLEKQSEQVEHRLDEIDRTLQRILDKLR